MQGKLPQASFDLGCQGRLTQQAYFSAFQNLYVLIRAHLLVLMLKMILTLKSRSFKGTFGIFDFLWISSVFFGFFPYFRTFVYSVPKAFLP